MLVGLLLSLLIGLHFEGDIVGAELDVCLAGETADGRAKDVVQVTGLRGGTGECS